MHISHADTHLSSIRSARDVEINSANGICEMPCQLPPCLCHAPSLSTMANWACRLHSTKRPETATNLQLGASRTRAGASELLNSTTTRAHSTPTGQLRMKTDRNMQETLYPSFPLPDSRKRDGKRNRRVYENEQIQTRIQWEWTGTGNLHRDDTLQLAGHECIVHI
jgi:hypothetical protein